MHKSEIESFRTETLIAHNQYRAQHSTTPLSLSFQLCDGAQQWADHLAKGDKFERSPEDEYYNENVACTWGSQLTGTLISRMWYEEGKDYDYTRNTLSKFTQNFTQLLWKESREMGVGRARTKHGKEIIVVRYHPPGNTGDFTANVLRSSEFRETSIPVIDNLALNRIPGLRQFQEDCLLAHNKYRQRHRAPPLQWSYKLAYEAQKWAQHLLDSELFTHSENSVYGENLAGRKGYDLNGKKATKLWYDESKLFNFDEPSFSPDTGNFTQLIWRGSRYFGVGKAFNNDMCIVVAYYFPPGNIVEEFNENVGIIQDSVDGTIAETTKPAGIMAEYGQYELEKFRTEFLIFINYLRARHASPPLTVSHLLMNNAQNWANQLLRSGKITYSNDENIGESIAYAEKEDLTAFKISHRWYGEIQSHDFSSANPNAQTLNFTQLVWHDSRELGVGKAVGKDGFSVVVAHYSPPGNTDGIVKENVGKLCSPDMKEIASMKKRRYDENANIIEDKGIKNGFAGIISPSRTEETFVFRPPSGEFNQLVWIDRSSTPLERGKQPEVNGDLVMKENTPEHEYESPPPSPSRAVDQIEKLLTNTRQTWETESSGEEDMDEETEPRKPDVNEYVVLSKSTSREDIGSEEGSVYKRLSRTFSEEMEYSRQDSVREEEEPPPTSKSPHHPLEDEKESRAEHISEEAKTEELKNDNGLQSPIVLRKSQQYVQHYDKEFGQVKEASIVTRPQVRDIKGSEDWQMIDDIIQSSRTLRLSQHMNDETLQSPEGDGQRAVIRRIDEENTIITDPALPVLEHVVTPTFARALDHSVVDQEFNNLFSEDTPGNEPETENQNLQADCTPTFKDKKYEEEEQFLSERSDHVELKVLEPIEHINISREIRECSYAVSDDVFNLIEEFPGNNQSLHQKSPQTGALEEESVGEGQTKVLLEESIIQEPFPTVEKTKNVLEEQQLQESPKEKQEHYVSEHPGEDKSVKKEEVLLQESEFQEKPVPSLEEDILEEELGQHEVSDYPETEHVEREGLLLEDSTIEATEVFIVEKIKSFLQEQSLEESPEEKLEHHEVSENHKGDFIFQEETAPNAEEAERFFEEQPPKDSPVEKFEHHVLENSEDQSVQNKEVSPEESKLEDELASSIDKAKGFVEEQPVQDILDEKLEQHDIFKDPEERFVEQLEGLEEESTLQETVSCAEETKGPVEQHPDEDSKAEKPEQHDVFENPENAFAKKEEILLEESILEDEQASSIEETKSFVAEQPIQFNEWERIEHHHVSEHTEEQPEKREEVLIEKSRLQKYVFIVEETKSFVEEELVEKSPEEKLEQYDASEHHEQDEPDENDKLLPEESILEDKSTMSMEETKSFVEEQPAKDSLEQNLEQHLEGESMDEILSVKYTEESVLEEKPIEESPEKNLEQNEVFEYPEGESIDKKVLAEASIFQEEVPGVDETIRFVEEQPIEDSHQEKLEQQDVSKHSEDESVKQQGVLSQESILEKEPTITVEETKGFVDEQPIEESPDAKVEQYDVYQHSKEDESYEKEELLPEQSILEEEPDISEELTTGMSGEQPAKESSEEKQEQQDVSENPEEECAEKETLLVESIYQKQSVLSSEEKQSSVEEEPTEDSLEQKLEQYDIFEHLEEESIFQEEPVPRAEKTRGLVEEQSVTDSPKEKLEQHGVFQTPEKESVEKQKLLLEDSIFQQEPVLSLKETQSFVEGEPTKDQHDVFENLEEESVEKKETLPEESMFQEEPVSSVEETQSLAKRQSIEDSPEKELDHHEVSEESVQKEEILFEESTLQQEEVIIVEVPKNVLEKQPSEYSLEEKLEQHNVSETPEKKSVEKEEIVLEESIFREPVSSFEETQSFVEDEPTKDSHEQKLDQHDVFENPEEEYVEKKEIPPEEFILQEEPVSSVGQTQSFAERQSIEDSTEQQLDQHELSEHSEEESVEKEEVLLEQSTLQQEVLIVEETKNVLEKQASEYSPKEKLEQHDVSEYSEGESVEQREVLEDESIFQEPISTVESTKGLEEDQLVDDSSKEKVEHYELHDYFEKDQSDEKNEIMPEDSISQEEESVSSTDGTKSFVEEQPIEYRPDDKLEQHDVSEHPEQISDKREAVLMEKLVFQKEAHIAEEIKNILEEQPVEKSPEEKLEQHEVFEDPERESAEEKVLEEKSMLPEEAVPSVQETKGLQEEQPVEASAGESLERHKLLEHPTEDKSMEKDELLPEQSILGEEPTIRVEKTKSSVKEKPMEVSLERQPEPHELSEQSESDESVEQEDVLLEESTFQEDEVHIVEEKGDFLEEQPVENSAEENLEHHEHSEHPEEETVEREEKLVEESILLEETKSFVEEQPVENSPEETLEHHELLEHYEKDESVEKEEALPEESVLQEEPFSSVKATKGFVDERIEQQDVSQHPEEKSDKRDVVLIEKSTFQKEVLLAEETKSFLKKQPVQKSPDEKLEQHGIFEYPEGESIEKKELLAEESIFQEEVSSVTETENLVQEQPIEDREEKLEQHDVSKHSERESTTNEVWEEESMLQDETDPSIAETKRFDEQQPAEESSDESLEHHELLRHPEEDKSVEKEEIPVLEEETIVNIEKTKSILGEQPIKDSPEEMCKHHELSEEDASVEQQEVLLEESICQEDDVLIAEETKSFLDEQPVENSAKENLKPPEHSEQPEEEPAEREVKLVQEPSFEEGTKSFVEEQPIDDSQEKKLEQHDVSNHSERESAKNEVLEEEAMLQEETDPSIEETKRFDEQQPAEDSPDESLEHHELLQHPEDDKSFEKEELLQEQSVLEEEPTVNVEETKSFVEKQPVQNSPEEKLEQHNVSEDREEVFAEPQEVLSQESIFQKPFSTVEDTKDLNEEQPEEDNPEEKLERQELSEHSEDECVEQQAFLAEERMFQDEPVFSVEKKKGFVEEQPVDESPEEQHEQHACDHHDKEHDEKQELLLEKSIEQLLDDRQEEKLEHPELPEHSQKNELVEKSKIVLEECILQEEPVSSVEETKSFVEEQPIKYSPEEKLEQHDVPEHPKEEPDERRAAVMEASILQKEDQPIDDSPGEKHDLSKHPEEVESVKKEEVLPENTAWEEPTISMEDIMEKAKGKENLPVVDKASEKQQSLAGNLTLGEKETAEKEPVGFQKLSTKEKQTTVEELPFECDIQDEEQDDGNEKTADKEEREKKLEGEREMAEKELEIQDERVMLVSQDDKQQPSEQIEEKTKDEGTTINEKSASDRKQKIEQHEQLIQNLREKPPEPDTEPQETESQEGEHSPKHVRFSSACEVFEEKSMPIVDTVEVEDTTTVNKDDQKICEESSEESVNQEELQADEDDVDVNSRWVELEKNPVVWHTVTATQEQPEQKSNEKERDRVVDEGEKNTTKENEHVPDEVIHISAHAIVKDVLKQALDQTEEKGDVSFTPRLVRTESGNMVIVKMEDTGSLEERYELMEFELHEQYMKEKGTFAPFLSEFPCDVDNVFSSTEADKPLEPLEDLQNIGEEEEDVDNCSERPLLASHLSIIMEEPPSGTDSLSGSLVKLQAENDSADNSGEYVITSPSEFDIVHSTVREVQNKRQKTEMGSEKNIDDGSAPTTDDEFILLWRSSEKQPNMHETAEGDKRGLESACISEQEIDQETPIGDFEDGEENTKEKASASESEQMDYLKLDLRESPDVPSESSVSPGSSVRSWISSDLSSLDDETTGKHHKNREHPDNSTEEKEILGVELIDSELSRHEQAMEQTHDNQKVINDPNESKATEPEANVDHFQEQITPLELQCPPDSCTKHVAVSTEQDGDKKVTRVVTTETTKKVVQIIDCKEVPLEGEQWGQLESKFSDLVEKKGTFEQPAVATGEHDDGWTTITTAVTRQKEKEPVVASDKTDSVEKQSETEQCHVESGVFTEEHENGEVKTTITRDVTRNVEVNPALELGEHVGKRHIESFETPVVISTNDQDNDEITTNMEHLSESVEEIMEQSSEEEKEVITEEQDQDDTKTAITRVVTTTTERAPISELATEGAVGEILEKIHEARLGESEITTEEHDEDGVKTTITRVVTRKEISESKLISDEQFRETLQPFHKETEQLEPVVTDICEKDDGIVKRTITRTVTRTVKKEPILTLGNQDDSIKAMLEKLKKQEGNDQQYALLQSKDDDDKITETTRKQYNTGLCEDPAQEIIGDFPTERKVSHELTKDEDGTVTTITRIETHCPMVMEHPDVLKEMLERTDQHSLEIAPSVEHVDHGDDHVVRKVKKEVREVTTMESTSALVLLGDFQARVLLEHNKCRYIHYSRPLTWSDRLAKEAQIWAEHLAESGCLKHATSSEYGENVAYSSEVLNGYDLSQRWYDEIKHYSFLKPGFTTQTAHFTQMVWEGTKEMGVGMALAPDGTSYFVARYYPPGNKLGCFEQNVLSPRENAVEGRPRKKKSISPPSPPNEIDTIKHDCLVTHNYHRFQHGASELSWSPMLAVEALHSAERVIRTGSIHNSDRSNSGENIAMSSDRSFDVKVAIELWYKEEKDYDYTSPAFSSLTRNFSQMLWKECKEVGMALARSDSEDLVVVVAKYFPPGNVVGMFQDNVLPNSQESRDL